jgi:hypothetical protein
LEERTPIIAAKISLIGTFLILVNLIVVIANGSPIILSSYSAPAVEELIGSSPSWARVAFGFRALTQEPWMIIWIITASLNFFLAILLYLRPERPQNVSLLILVFSVFSIFIGGGFFVGLILGVIGGIAGLQFRQPLRTTFAGKILRALRLDGTLFEYLKKERATEQAAFLIMLISFLSAFGSGLYVYNVNRIHSSAEEAVKILLLGDCYWDNSILYMAFINIGIGVFKWLFLTLTIFVVGKKLMAASSGDFEATIRAVAFAYAPIALQVFLPLLYFNEPYLSLNWPLTVHFIITLWIVLALIIAVKKLFDLQIKRAIGLVILSGTFYWFTTYEIVFPILNIEMPGLFFEIQPMNVVMMLISLSVILSLLFGAFSKQQ